MPSLSLCAPLSCWLQTGDIRQSTLPCFLYSDNRVTHTTIPPPTPPSPGMAVSVLLSVVWRSCWSWPGGQCSAAVTRTDNGPDRPSRTLIGGQCGDNRPIVEDNGGCVPLELDTRGRRPRQPRPCPQSSPLYQDLLCCARPQPTEALSPASPLLYCQSSDF